MPHHIRVFPLGNADSTRIKLHDGEAWLIWDFAGVRGDEDGDLRWPLANELGEELSEENRNRVEVLGFTHLDRDHTCGASDFFYFEYAKAYQGPDRVRFEELWVPAAAITDKDVEDDAWVIRQEAKYRLREGKGIRVFSRPELLKDWLEKEGLSIEERQDCFVDAGNLVPNRTIKAKGLEVFVHSPFATRQDEEELKDRNRDAIAGHFRFKIGGEDVGEALFLTDLGHEELDRMISTTEFHGNEERLRWDIMHVPHHGSYRSLAEDREDIEARDISDEIERLYSKYCNPRARVVVPCRPLAKAEEKDDNDPPHRQAIDYYRKQAQAKNGEIFLTMEFPKTNEPKPIDFVIGRDGVTVKKVEESSRSQVTTSSPPRAGHDD